MTEQEQLIEDVTGTIAAGLWLDANPPVAMVPLLTGTAAEFHTNGAVSSAHTAMMDALAALIAMAEQEVVTTALGETEEAGDGSTQ